MMLFLRNPESNLSLVLREVIRFGAVSGLAINRTKSEMFPLTDTTLQTPLGFLLQWCTDPPKYLSVYLHRQSSEVIRLNYGPAIDKLPMLIDKWIQLPLSRAGRIAIIKMVVLPCYLYLFLNILITLSCAFFDNLRSALTRLIWAGKHSRIVWNSLTLPYERGGFGIPDLYYLIAQPILPTIGTIMICD